MNYPIETSICSKNGWFTPAEAKNYYDRYSRDGVTIHWWGGGETADKHDGIVSYFMGQAQQGVKSVNYVVSDIKITKMVEPDNVAWASQSGNPTTVSIEFQPTLSDEGYKRGGWLIAQLEAKYGKTLQLWPHNHWFQTSCPGTIDINRLRSEADKAKGGDMPTLATKEEVDSLANAYLHDNIANNPGLMQYVGRPFGDIIAVFNGAPERANFLDRITLNKGDIINVYGKFLKPQDGKQVYEPTPQDFDYHLGQKGSDWKEFIYDLMQRKDLLQPGVLTKEKVVKYIQDNLK